VRIIYLPKSITLSLTLLLLGLLLVSPQALTFIDSTAFLRGAAAQELREHISHNRPPPSPEVNDPNLRVETVFEGLELPTSMAFLGENDILVTEKDSGRVQRIVDGELQEEPVIDVQVANNDERGLLGIDISNNTSTGTSNNQQYAFLFFTESGGGEDGDDWSGGIAPTGTRLYRYNIVPGIGENAQVQLSNETLLLDLPATPGPRYHGGPVAIGPDNNVYVVIGTVDHHETQAQNFEDAPAPDGTSGVIRITQEGQVADIQGVISDEIPVNLYYGYGIRQSFGMEFDPVTGNLWDTENGPNQYDELNLIEPGFNSGWRDLSGLAERAVDINVEEDLVHFDGRGRYSDPEFTWQQTVAPTGLDFLNSSGLGAAYQNDLFVGDYNNGNLYNFDLNENRTQLVLGGGLADRAQDPGDGVDDILFGTGFGGITDVKTGPDGYLYVLTFQEDEGSIFRIVPDTLAEDDTDEAEDDTDEAEVAEEETAATADTGDTDDADDTDEAEVAEEETAGNTGAPSLGQILAERIAGNTLNQ
jgi:aldose sugar dehydrogenase